MLKLYLQVADTTVDFDCFIFREVILCKKYIHCIKLRDSGPLTCSRVRDIA